MPDFAYRVPGESRNQRRARMAAVTTAIRQRPTPLAAATPAQIAAALEHPETWRLIAHEARTARDHAPHGWRVRRALTATAHAADTIADLLTEAGTHEEAAAS